MKVFRLFLVLLFCCFAAHSQQGFPQDYFDSPIKLAVAPSGTFGELRNNHFHSGIDLRINGTVGEPIYAPADGYVSRIKVSPVGGGKMLYIDHPNGFRTVYFHLDAYEGEVGKYIYEHQYRNKKFEVEVFPEKDKFPVKKGQMIARGGNTGGSGGPHLHYEIRFAYNDQTINPLLFGLKMEDKIKPTIKDIHVYVVDTNAPSGSHTLLSNLTKTVKKTIKDNNGKTRTVNTTVKVDTLKAWGTIYFGIDARDQSTGSTSNLGITEIKLHIDDSLFYSYDMKSFRFDQTRYINSMIDYPAYIKNKRRYLLTRISPGNKIHLVDGTQNNGYFDCTDGGLHKLVYEVSDFSGNTTKRTFFIRSDESAQKTTTHKEAEGYERTLFNYDADNRFDTENFVFVAKQGVFFENLNFRYKEEKDSLKYYSNIHNIKQDQAIPVFTSFTVKIKPTDTIPEHLKRKMIVARIENGKLYSEGGAWDGEYLSMNTTNFGAFAISLDTIPPVVKPVNFTNNKQVGAVKLRVKITDALSGISSYNCYLNNEWILAEYDAKNNVLILDSGKRFKKGTNKLKVVVSDRRDNVTTKEYTLTH